MLAACLESLRPLLDGEATEVVVVDDGSVSDEAQRIESVVAAFHGSAFAVRIPHSGAASARNRGLAMAHRRFVWFVDADDFLLPGCERIIPILQSLPDDADIMTMGSMHLMRKADQRFHAPEPFAEATSEVSKESILVPHTPSLDHFTLIIRRTFLLAHPDLRYVEDMSILEDTVFTLRLTESAEKIYSNPTLRFYVHRACQPSLTAGAWSTERSRLFIGDICRFFVFFNGFVARHREWEGVSALYRRYRYVYLRVLAVKGCPWTHLSQFRDTVSPMGLPHSIPEAFLFLKPTHRLLAFLCRTLRNN